MDTSKLEYKKYVDLRKLIDDAISLMKIADADRVEYIFGKVFNGTLKIVFEPNLTCNNSLSIDGVDGFGYCAVTER